MKKLGMVAAIGLMILSNVFAGTPAINVTGRMGWIGRDNDPAHSNNSNSSSLNIDYLRTTLTGVAHQRLNTLLRQTFLTLMGRLIQ